MQTPYKLTTNVVAVVPWRLSQSYQASGTAVTNAMEQVCQ